MISAPGRKEERSLERSKHQQGACRRLTFRAANGDGRTVTFELNLPLKITLAETEVFGALMDDIGGAANENIPDGDR